VKRVVMMRRGDGYGGMGRKLERKGVVKRD